MQPRIKKLIGFAVLLPGLFLYVAAAAWLGSRLPASTLVQLLYYLVAGVVWAFPAGYLIRWMTRPAASDSAGDA